MNDIFASSILKSSSLLAFSLCKRRKQNVFRGGVPWIRSKNDNQSVSDQIHAWLQSLIIFPQLRQLLPVVEASTHKSLI
jgi:hypothetical protein